MRLKCPDWFRVLFTVTMLAVCVLLAVITLQQNSLRAQRDDLMLKLETSRGRVAKQIYEYNQVQAELPEVLAALESAQPQADAAKTEENRLRQERKTLRESAKALQTEAEALEIERNEAQKQVNALLAQVEAQRQTLLDLMDALQVTADALNALMQPEFLMAE